MLLTLDDASRYQKLEDLVRKVCKIYNYKECKLNSVLDDNSILKNLDKFYYMLPSSSSYNLHLASRNSNSFLLSVEVIELGVSILKGLGIKDISIKLNCSNNDDIINTIKDIGNIIAIDDSLINSFSIYAGDSLIISGSISDIVSFDCDLLDLYNLSINSSKRLIADNMIHAYFIADGKKALKEASKVINVCRLGGLISYINYDVNNIDDEFNKVIDFNSLFTVYLNDELLNDFKVKVIGNSDDTEDIISIYDVYPFILNKLNKKTSPCSACKEEKK